VEFQLRPSEESSFLQADTIGFSRMEFQFQLLETTLKN